MLLLCVPKTIRSAEEAEPGTGPGSCTVLTVWVWKFFSVKGSLRLTPGRLTLLFSYLASLSPKNSSEYPKYFIPYSS